MKNIALIALVFLIVSCTTYPNSLSYRPAGSTENPYVITTEFNELTRTVLVFINGSEVIRGKVSFLDGTGEFFGEYKGNNVNLSCRNDVRGCLVLINNEFVGTVK